ncbi:MAG: arginine N-succinyltransferase [Planctomycetaceae bacterium]
MMGEFVRAVRLDDVDRLYDMIGSVTPGLTTLMLDRDRLLERVERSHFAFSKRSETPSGEPYVLVMEDEATGRLVGTSTVYGKTGGYEPLYAYRIVTILHNCPQLGLSNRPRTSLHLQRIYDGPTEIGSLFMLPEFRGAGRGRLLSLSRFALLAQRPHRFGQRVIAEMRGHCDADGISPFWEAVMRPFFEVDFPVADALSTISKAFIEDLMPQYPLYLDLMPDSAKQVIGRVHPETEAAVKLLRDEGFAPTELVDIFDGGPVLQQQTALIDAVKRCQKHIVVSIGDTQEANVTIVTSTHEGFRGCLAEVQSLEDGRSVRINEQAAAKLGVGVGDEVWCMSPRPASAPASAPAQP